MSNKLTSTDINRIADKVMVIIGNEVKGNSDLAEIVLFECQTRSEVGRKLWIAGHVEGDHHE